MYRVKMIKVLLELDKPNKNGRIYTKEVMREAIAKYGEKLSRFGELGYGEDSHINIDRISHKVNFLYIKENQVLADISLLGTPCGKIAKALPDFNIGPRGLGKFAEDGITLQSYEFISIDIVQPDN